MSNHHDHNQNGCCTTSEEAAGGSINKNAVLKHWKPAIGFILLSAGLVMDYLLQPGWFTGPVRLAWYLAAYLPVGIPVLRQAAVHLKKGDIFTEFFLMGIATLGAFYIGEYPEGVAVMLFYSIGEAFQHGAASKARANIKALLDVRPEEALLLRDGDAVTVHPGSVSPGQKIRVKPGERIPLDGTLLSKRSAFDTSALTGESKPRHFKEGDSVLAGMINLNNVIELQVTKSYENSSISRILKMVQEASSRKAKTELFIRSFARVYTPAVVFLATLLVILPSFFVDPYIFDEWLYRGLVFLVISCPCALVISIPLGYFGGIGAASRNGILVKGGNYLDALKDVKTVVFDKTGTLTEGVFAVRDVHISDEDLHEVLPMVLAAEKNSTHPIAKAITDTFSGKFAMQLDVENQKEIPGHGVEASISGKEILIGNRKLLESYDVTPNGQLQEDSATVVYVAVDRVYKGSIVIADRVKADAADAIRELKKAGVRQTVMLSGDTEETAQSVGKALGIDRVYGGLLPEEKAEKLEQLKREFPGVIAYAGDGINDAPVLALSDVGIAMGAMGSDVAVETADVVIQSDQPSRIATGIKIGKETRNIVWQNIGLAMGIKILFLGLGAFGIASLWEAVFADVGVALLAILNAIRIQKMEF
ncbi:cadmium-translocating P-type ATPase [Rhodohalobacter sp. SW132]|uniref:heavy metal translocating P-type ATPase n=1 Tax=Rhodohalobacter sp. SW132 TaxID=2293433 RepID=UPI000E23C0B3|nr:heavy metal translocating P-type ATPase [Rhodohalobacter sp. SW132]REL38400.1 cadmium-translocating P-type ATPase [Rhodohalobacter sp. SW132]